MNIRRAVYAQGDRQKVHAEVTAEVLNNPEKYLSQYSADDRTHDGHVVSADLMKEMFSQYAGGPEVKARFNDPVHSPAQALADEQFSRVLADATSSNADQALFLTGVSGSGKSTSIETMLASDGLPETVRLIYERQLANPDVAAATMQRALEAGVTPTIVAINIDPETALHNTLDRADSDGRGATMHSMAAMQSALPESLEHVRDLYGDRVNLVIIDKSNGMENATVHAGWDNLNLLENGSYEQIRSRLESALEQFREQNEYSQHAIDQAYGRAPQQGGYEHDRTDGETNARVDKSEDVSLEAVHELGGAMLEAGVPPGIVEVGEAATAQLGQRQESAGDGDNSMEVDISDGLFN